jgi:hypothetical protein
MARTHLILAGPDIACGEAFSQDGHAADWHRIARESWNKPRAVSESNIGGWYPLQTVR